MGIVQHINTIHHSLNHHEYVLYAWIWMHTHSYCTMKRKNLHLRLNGPCEFFCQLKKYEIQKFGMHSHKLLQHVPGTWYFHPRICLQVLNPFQMSCNYVRTSTAYGGCLCAWWPFLYVELLHVMGNAFIYCIMYEQLNWFFWGWSDGGSQGCPFNSWAHHPLVLQDIFGKKSCNLPVSLPICYFLLLMLIMWFFNM